VYRETASPVGTPNQPEEVHDADSFSNLSGDCNQSPLEYAASGAFVGKERPETGTVATLVQRLGVWFIVNCERRMPTRPGTVPRVVASDDLASAGAGRDTNAARDVSRHNFGSRGIAVHSPAGGFVVPRRGRRARLSVFLQLSATINQEIDDP
jgi:hypothetical protein